MAQVKSASKPTRAATAAYQRALKANEDIQELLAKCGPMPDYPTRAKLRGLMIALRTGVNALGGRLPKS